MKIRRKDKKKKNKKKPKEKMFFLKIQDLKVLKTKMLISKGFLPQ
jgi:hypothetical protein